MFIKILRNPKCRTGIPDLLLLCLLAPAAYLPTLVFSSSTNPLVFLSGLAVARGGVTAGQPWLDPNAGYTTQALGALSAHDWLHGSLPWWNPYMGVGLPLAAEMQTASLFLPFTLLLDFQDGSIYLKLTLQILAGLATYALLRHLKLSRPAALVGAILYEFNGTFAWFGHGPIMPLPFLPIFLFGIERALSSAQRTRPGGWSLLTLGLAYSLYAGFPETAFLNGLFILAWTIFRLATAPSASVRFAFGKKVIAGGLAGLCLSAPVLLPFFEYLQLSAISHTGFNQLSLPLSSLASLLMPYIFGPLSAFTTADASGELSRDWQLGGYLDLSTLFFGIVALIGAKPQKGIRLLLASWTLLMLGRTLGIPALMWFFGHIPGMDLIALYRYSEPSWEFAAALLVAFAIDDWKRKSVTRPQVSVALASSLSCAIASVLISWPLIGRLLHGSRHGYATWLAASASWGLFTLIAAAIIYSGIPTGKRLVALSVLVSVDALCLYSVPLLSARRNASIDLGAVNFLQQHLELQRFYTLGPISPNYGGYFSIASINHNAVPVSADWFSYVRSHLDLGLTEPSLFIGSAPPPVAEREANLRSHLQSFESLGVKYIVAPPQSEPFMDPVTVGLTGPNGTRNSLGDGQEVSGTFPPDLVKSGSVSKVGLTISTYGGSADGILVAKLCAHGQCSVGNQKLTGAADNNRLEIELTQPLLLTDRQPVKYSFKQTSGKMAAGVWLWPNLSAASHQATPEVWLGYASANPRPRRVYQGRTADIFELPGPSAYFGTSETSCKLTAESRQQLQAICTHPAVLIRRELFYPGWQASLNGREEKVSRIDSIFQSVTLPAGHSRLTFSYRPSHIQQAYWVFLGGLLLFAAGWIKSLFKSSASVSTP